MPKPQQSAGSTMALAGGATGYLIVILMYLAKHFGIEDMDVTVATAFVSTALMIAGAVANFAHEIGCFVLRICGRPPLPPQP